MNLRRFLHQEITVASVVAVDNRGQATLGPKRTVAVRVEGYRRLVRKANGQEATSDHKIFTDQTVLITDRIWLPGVDATDETKAKMPMSIDSVPSLHDTCSVLWEVTI